MQPETPAQLTNVPPKPTCQPAALSIFGRRSHTEISQHKKMIAAKEFVW